MKYVCVLVLLVVTAGLGVHSGAHAQTSESRPPSTMQQLMQGIVFPNANVIFAAQTVDPASIQRDAQPSLSTNALTGLYGGWQAIENSGLALAEAADLLNARGRVCSNGRPVPVGEADWKAAVAALRESGFEVAGAARARSQDRMGDVTEGLTNACSGCHRIYRVRGNACMSMR